MPDVVYRSEVPIERVGGPVRRAYLPAKKEPVIFGVHGAVPSTAGCHPRHAILMPPHSTTLLRRPPIDVMEHVEARQINASNERLVSEAAGEIELEDNVLVIRRMHVRLTLKAPQADWEAAGRVHGFFADKCPVFRSLKAAIAITTELILRTSSPTVTLPA